MTFFYECGKTFYVCNFFMIFLLLFLTFQFMPKNTNVQVFHTQMFSYFSKQIGKYVVKWFNLCSFKECYCNNLMYKMRKSNNNELSYFGLIEEKICPSH